MTKLELLKMSRRVDEIDAILSAMPEGEGDPDICDNLEAELNAIIYKIEASMKLARIQESGLRLVN